MSLSERSAYLERLLIEHCSPTLACIKTGNLFTISYDNKNQLNEVVRMWNEYLSGKGITVYVLKKGGGKAMLYVYRKDKLREDFEENGVKRFMKSCGYVGTDVDYAVRKLGQRISQCDSFPHEIGLFLGYPLGDVIGFIDNAGKNCKCTGYWKVYCNEEEAEKTFRKFNKCRNVYSKLWEQGKSVLQLTVGNADRKYEKTVLL